MFYALPKELAISVRDSKSDQSIYGAEVQVKYYDQATDHHVEDTSVEDSDGVSSMSLKTSDRQDLALLEHEPLNELNNVADAVKIRATLDIDVLNPNSNSCGFLITF